MFIKALEMTYFNTFTSFHTHLPLEFVDNYLNRDTQADAKVVG